MSERCEQHDRKKVPLEIGHGRPALMICEICAENLERLIAGQLGPMTADEIFEQKVSWVYGQMALSNSDMSKDEIRQRLLK